MAFVQLCCEHAVDELGVVVGSDEHFWGCIDLFRSLRIWGGRDDWGP